MKFSRRGFLGILTGAIAAAVAPAIVADPERTLWVPGAKTIMLPPAGGWVTPESVPAQLARRTLRVELFPAVSGLFQNEFNPMAITPERLVQAEGRVYRVAQVELRREMKELYGAWQYPVVVARRFMKCEAELEEVFGVPANTVPALRNYVKFEETVHYDAYTFEDPREKFSMTRSSFTEREQMRAASLMVDQPNEGDETLDYKYDDWEETDDDADA